MVEQNNGKGHGIYKLYYDNCQLKVAIRYENGHQLDGVVDSFDENGFLIRTVEIINGNKNGHFKEFYPSGTIKKEGEYEDDEIIGKPIEYLEDGSIKEDNEDEYLEGLELDSNKSITFIDKTAFINKLKNLDESSIIEIRFDSEKWSINDKATVAGIWNGKNYILYADEWIKNAELIWEETLEELINLLTDNELEDIDSNNCWLGLEGSDGSNIEVNKIEWEPSLSIEDEKKFKDEYGDGIKLFREGQVDNDLFFEAGAIIGIRVITEDEEFYLTEEENIDESDDDNEYYNDNSFHLGYILGQISYEDEYELEDITLYCIQVEYDDCDFGFEGIIWISFDEETDEPYRVIEVPDDFDLEENIGGNYSLGSFNSYGEATRFIENLKTISFNKLKELTGYPDNENLCYFRNNIG